MKANLMMGLLFLLSIQIQAQNTQIQSIFTKMDSLTVRNHLQELSSDAYEGRGTGSAGEEKAREYIANAFREVGLTPLGENNTYFQQVKLRSLKGDALAPLNFTHENGQGMMLKFVDNFILTTDIEKEESVWNAAVKGQLVFVGYGIQATSENWDDFKNVDVRGKVLVGFVNDPPATPQEPNRFKAGALTYFGRWTYKFEEARRRGALGMLLIHTTPTASYPFQVLSATARNPQISLQGNPTGALAMRGWLTQESGEALAFLCGSSLDKWFAMAARRDFRPIVLPVQASSLMRYEKSLFESANVIAGIKGSEKPNETIIFTSHHDHLGIGREVNGDKIYNGAIDNASGVAMQLAMAKAIQYAEWKPKRSLVFMTVTAEESGLLGSQWYAEHPLLSLDRTIANINIDSGNAYGETEDFTGLGSEQSDLESLLQRVAQEQKLSLVPDPNPNAGSFFRSDQLNFARKGVPAVFLNSGKRYKGRPESYYTEKQAEYLARRYHQPTDEFNPDWQMSGFLQIMRIATHLAYVLDESPTEPKWKPSADFKRPETDASVSVPLPAYEIMPEPIGGIAALLDKLVYPKDAKDARKEGRVVVQFTVDENGNPFDPVVLTPLFPSLDAEAVRVLLATKFTPAKVNGWPTKMRMSIPIRFVLE